MPPKGIRERPATGYPVNGYLSACSHSLVLDCTGLHLDGAAVTTGGGITSIDCGSTPTTCSGMLYGNGSTVLCDGNITTDGSGNLTTTGGVTAYGFAGEGGGLTNLNPAFIQISGSPDGYVLTISGSVPTWQPASGGGGGMAVGYPVSSGTNNTVLFIDGSGNLACTTNFTYDGLSLQLPYASFGVGYGVTAAGGAFQVDTSGNVTGASFYGTHSGDGNYLTNLNPANLQTGGAPDTYVLTITSGYPTWQPAAAGSPTVDSSTTSNMTGMVYGNGSALYSDSAITTDGSGNLQAASVSASSYMGGSFSGDGTNVTNVVSSNVNYSAGNSSNWSGGSPPSTVADALDRIAAALTSAGYAP